MRRTAFRLASKLRVETHFDQVDRSVSSAERLAYEQEAKLHKSDGTLPQTTLEKIAATPELADTVLRVSSKLGSEVLLIRPTHGNPTGLTELHEHPHPRHTLLKIYDHTLSLLEEKYPKDSIYRTSVENLTKARRDIVAAASQNDEIEQKIGSGLVEEILTQAADEFRLAQDLADSQPWAELEEKPVEGQWIAHSFKDQPEPPR